jgi:hypothetical protein
MQNPGMLFNSLVLIILTALEYVLIECLKYTEVGVTHGRIYPQKLKNCKTIKKAA